jgi:hypothetical protein
MEKDEKSILQMLAKAKEDLSSVASEQKQEQDKEGEKKGEEGQKKELKAVEEQPKPAEMEHPQEQAQPEPNPISSATHFPAGDQSRVTQAIPERTSPEGVSVGSAGTAVRQKRAAHAERHDDDFIRFNCECGHRIKVHKRDAGKTGRCPKCSRWVEAPRQ